MYASVLFLPTSLKTEPGSDMDVMPPCRKACQGKAVSEPQGTGLLFT